MYEKTLIQEISSLIEARENCKRTNNTEWYEKHTERLAQLEDYLPSGSGIDSGTKIDLERSTSARVVLTFSYHHMNDCGMYDGWTDHSAIITPSFQGYD